MFTQNRVYVIAEAGVNHNGSLDMALKMVDAAAAAGADAVKFQTFQARKLVSKNAPKAQYQTQTTTADESQLTMLEKLQLSQDDHKAIIQHCGQRGITFLSTPFDVDSLAFLIDIGLIMVKIPSGEITNGPLLLKAAQTGRPILLSTGMSMLGEVEMALAVLAFGYTGGPKAPSIQGFYDAYTSAEGQQALKEKVVLLHCTTEYPAPFTDVNLLAMDTLGMAFGLPVGFSDHTPGIAVPIAAVARGAKIVEKHFTLDRTLPGPDHRASLEPDELKAMIESIRQVEAALGSSIKVPAFSENKNKTIARKSLVATKEIKKGELFSEENLDSKRPGSGVSPMLYWDFMSKTARRNYIRDEMIKDE